MPALLRIMGLSGLLAVPYPASAETITLNHLDCYFHETMQSIECPVVESVKTGRASNEPAPPRRTIAPKRKKSARCTTYRTYNPATRTYRGYDGITHSCR